MTKVAILFPGQGSQSIGMAKDLCQTLPAARQKFDIAASPPGLAQSHLGRETQQNQARRRWKHRQTPRIFGRP